MSFDEEVRERISDNGKNQRLCSAAQKFLLESIESKYSYNFSWLGRPIIQYPQDMVAMQEIIWQVRPDLIIETGIARGGSLIFYASMLALLDLAEAAESGETLNSTSPTRKVVGIDIEIRPENRAAIEGHPMYSRIYMLESSSIEKDTISKVHAIASDYQKILVCLDSNHTHDHVMAELEGYAGLVSVGSYCVVFDTIIEDLPDDQYSDRPWGIGNNPKTAVRDFLDANQEFEIDKSIQDKLLITVAQSGYLKRIQA